MLPAPLFSFLHELVAKRKTQCRILNPISESSLLYCQDNVSHLIPPFSNYSWLVWNTITCQEGHSLAQINLSY
jgi:hypothetical protein